MNSALAKRFWSKVNKNDHGGCWEWMACVTKRGYGKFSVARCTVEIAARYGVSRSLISQVRLGYIWKSVE